MNCLIDSWKTVVNQRVRLFVNNLVLAYEFHLLSNI